MFRIHEHHPKQYQIPIEQCFLDQKQDLLHHFRLHQQLIFDLTFLDNRSPKSILYHFRQHIFHRNFLEEVEFQLLQIVLYLRTNMKDKHQMEDRLDRLFHHDRNQPLIYQIVISQDHVYQLMVEGLTKHL